MHEPNFWSSCADAMELSVEGNRLIAREVADLVSGLWKRALRSFDGLLSGLGQHQHLPPA
jgi:hypothetical protein